MMTRLLDETPNVDENILFRRFQAPTSLYMSPLNQILNVDDNLFSEDSKHLHGYTQALWMRRCMQMRTSILEDLWLLPNWA